MIRSFFGTVPLTLPEGEPEMMLAALILNLIILAPLVFALLSGAAGMDAAFGARTDARLILTCVYAAIGVVSTGLIALHLAQHAWAIPMTVALFSVQIVYKLGTVVLVGLQSPVVITNLIVVTVQAVALAVLFARSQP